jgi:phosphomannomutase
MGLKFGTSGVRGLVEEMTDLHCFLYTRAFVQYVKSKASPHTLSLAGDFRESTPRILRAAIAAVIAEGLKPDYCGLVATTAVTYHAMQLGRPSLMVTGSHIPADRNGIKFNMPWGEVLKEDETEISARYRTLQKLTDHGPFVFNESGVLEKGQIQELPIVNTAAEAKYLRRYLDFFPEGCLDRLQVVVYQHSSVSRDILPQMIESLGAKVIKVGRSESFVPVDTEAVHNTSELASWIEEYSADALVSTDGDGDRPLLFDDTGKQVRGDLLGILVSEFLGADSVSIPVSCNSGAERSHYFRHVSRTRIGSPYVIASMNQALELNYQTVVGYEANGGFLTASDIESSETGNLLRALPTRDAALPILTALRRETCSGLPISQQLRNLPPAFSTSGLIRKFPNELGHSIVTALREGGIDLASHYFEDSFGTPESIDFTDGARITFTGGAIVHLRPSGNAPEFRCYTEAASPDTAAKNNQKALEIIENLIRPQFEKKDLD